MKVTDIIKEDIGAALAYKNLNSMQIYIMRKIAEGTLDEDKLSEKYMEQLDILRAYGLVAEIVPELTPEGQRALEMVQKFGNFENRHKEKALAAKPSTDLPMETDDLEYEVE